MLKKGDRFIYYGSPRTVKGVVERVNERVAFDLIHGVKIIRTTIVSDKGDKFDSSHCRKIIDDLLPKFIRKIRKGV